MLASRKRVKFLEKIQWTSSPLVKWGAFTAKTHGIKSRGYDIH
jgi:hypothetical protein